MNKSNLLANLPEDLSQEHFEELLRGDGVRVERIVSLGHTSPESGWYDQDWAEWVLLLTGAAELEFEQGGLQPLVPGDHVTIPAHCRHRVTHTSADEATVWLAVHFRTSP
ncbi:MAG: cupin domain-containing protein [Pseudomonadota bacterium]